MVGMTLRWLCVLGGARRGWTKVFTGVSRPFSTVLKKKAVVGGEVEEGGCIVSYV